MKRGISSVNGRNWKQSGMTPCKLEKRPRPALHSLSLLGALLICLSQEINRLTCLFRQKKLQASTTPPYQQCWQTRARKTRDHAWRTALRVAFVVCFGYVWRKAMTLLFSWEPANVILRKEKAKAGAIRWKHVLDQEISRKWKLRREFFHRITTRAYRFWRRNRIAVDSKTSWNSSNCYWKQASES